MCALEDWDKKTRWVGAAEVRMPMVICEEPDISYPEGPKATTLLEVMGSTKVGGVRKELDKLRDQLLSSVLCGDDSKESDGVQPDLGASIFDHGSRMGLIPGEAAA